MLGQSNFDRDQRPVRCSAFFAGVAEGVRCAFAYLWQSSQRSTVTTGRIQESTVADTPQSLRCNVTGEAPHQLMELQRHLSGARGIAVILVVDHHLTSGRIETSNAAIADRNPVGITGQVARTTARVLPRVARL
jgi:hypothetical protein